MYRTFQRVMKKRTKQKEEKKKKKTKKRQTRETSERPLLHCPGNPLYSSAARFPESRAGGALTGDTERGFQYSPLRAENTSDGSVLACSGYKSRMIDAPDGGCHTIWILEATGVKECHD